MRSPTHNTATSIVRAGLFSLSSLLVVALNIPVTHAANIDDLPDMGNPAQATISLADEYQIGRMIVRGLRDQDQILEDPEVNEYIQSLGLRLTNHSQQNAQEFQFFIHKGTDINAFALPGGFVGVNAGLLLATHNESELAAVMAHEISHVTQRHIARSIAAQSRNGMVSIAAMLAAILVGATTGNGDAAIAGVAAAQTLALQQQVTFTRENEFEADSIGIQLLSQSGFDPNAMWTFFETIARQSGSAEAQLPAILRTHPVTSDRIADTKSRVTKPPVTAPQDSLSYALAKERLRVLLTPTNADPLKYYTSSLTNTEQSITPALLYGKALALMAVSAPKEAVPLLTALSTTDETVVQYRIALGQAQLLEGNGKAALATFNALNKLFPRNVPVTVRYAETLLQLGKAKQAHTILLDLFNNIAPTPEQARQIAFVANAAGDVADAYYYMSEYHILGGDLRLAMNQLQLALTVPNISSVQKARFQARLEEIQKAMPKRSAQSKTGYEDTR